jgi:uncharacterized protein (TIGR03067 family)
MRRFVSLALLVVLAAPPAFAQEATALQSVQGRWVVTEAEHNGKPIDGLNGGVMTVTGDAFEIRTASGNVLTGTLRVNAETRPLQMDLVHADGVRWEAVYEVVGDVFKLNYVDASLDDPRPSGFTTSPTTEESLVVLERRQG